MLVAPQLFELPALGPRHSGLEAGWRMSSPDGKEPACTSGGEAFYTIKQAMPFCIPHPRCWSAAWEPAGHWGRRVRHTSDSRLLLTLAVPWHGVSVRIPDFSLSGVRSGRSIFLLRVSLRVSAVLSSAVAAVSLSSGGCVSGN